MAFSAVYIKITNNCRKKKDVWEIKSVHYFLYGITSSELAAALHYLFSAGHQAEAGKMDVRSLKQFILAMLLKHSSALSLI